MKKTILILALSLPTGQALALTKDTIEGLAGTAVGIGALVTLHGIYDLYKMYHKPILSPSDSKNESALGEKPATYINFSKFNWKMLSGYRVIRRPDQGQLTIIKEASELIDMTQKEVGLGLLMSTLGGFMLYNTNNKKARLFLL